VPYTRTMNTTNKHAVTPDQRDITHASTSRQLRSNDTLADPASESISAKTKAIERNLQRINTAINTNETLLGTYATKRITLHDCLPEHLHLPQQLLAPNPQLLQTIKQIPDTPSEALQPPPFQFQMTPEATDFNTTLLQQHDYNIHKIITMNKTNCTPGIEFRDPNLLQLIFHDHALWEFTKDVLTNGAQLTFDHEPDSSQRIEENNALIAFDNHQKAKHYPEIINDSVTTDVVYGFAAPFRIEAINRIPGHGLPTGGSPTNYPHGRRIQSV
jgi:hypothetical protein